MLTPLYCRPPLTPPPQGACHFLEATAFSSTRKRDVQAMLQWQMRHGIASSAVFNREVVMFKVDALRNNAGA